MVNVAFKLDGGVVKKLDALAGKMSEARPGLAVTRTDVVRMAIHEFLQQQDRQRGR